MDDNFSGGMSKFRLFANAIELAQELWKAAVKSLEEREHFERFCENLQTEPGTKKPVLNDETATLYDTAGFGTQKLRELFDNCNIPNATFTNKEGKTVIAVPKQFEKQANMIVGISKELEVKPDLSPEQRQLVKNIAGDTPQLNAATQSLLANKNCTYQIPNDAYYQAFAGELKQHAIPFATFTDQRGVHTIIVDETFRTQLDQINRTLQQTKSALPTNEFTRQNLGKDIRVHEGITEGQARILRQELAGSCVGYNITKNDDGTYTFRYNAERSNIVGPALAKAVILTNGVSGKAVEAQSRVIESAAEQAQNDVASGKDIAVIDATDPQKGFVVNKDGIQGLDGTPIVRRSDPTFDARVYSMTYQMQAPLVKVVDDAHKDNIEGLYTKEEIVKAQEGAALANPDECTKIASQIACMSIAVHPSNANNLATAAVVQDTANTLFKVANGTEEDLNRMDLHELAARNNIDDASFYKADEALESFKSMSPDEQKQVMSCLEGAVDTPQMRSVVHFVGIEDLPLEDIGQEFDREDAEIGGGGEPSLGDAELGGDAPAMDE